VPTLAEAGYPNLEAMQWVGLLAPAGTPKPIIERLNAEVNRMLHEPDLVAKLATQGMEPAGGPPEAFQRTIEEEIERWTEVARTAGITAQE
jgi:tripartite-type tricarboxylate transporter receptor subunit TctC